MDSCRYAAVLLSRQSLRPCRNTAWVQGAAAAVRWAADQGLSVVSSVGLQTWELVTAIARLERIRLKIVLPVACPTTFTDEIARVRREFSLDDRDEVVGVGNLGVPARGQVLMAARDRAVAAQADMLVPVSIRAGGALDEIVRAHEAAGRAVEHRFEVRHSVRTTQLRYEVDTSDLTRELRDLDHKYIIHWTRTSDRPWPTEHAIDYYSSVIASESYPRSAWATLRNVLVTGRIVASTRHMPGNTATVSFSGLPPWDFAALMRWRGRYRQMSFEPHGVGIERAHAAACGILPVHYTQVRPRALIARSCAPSSGASVSIPTWRCQSVGKVGDWCQEDEYRCLGDFHLGSVPPECLVCICHRADEAAAIRQETGLRAVAFTHATPAPPGWHNVG